MKKLLIPAVILLLAGVVILLMPTFFQMTGLVLILLGLVLALWGILYDRAGKGGRTLLWTLAILASAGVIGLMTFMNLINDYGRTDWQEAGKADCAIVLGAGVRPDGTPSRIMNQRLRAAMDFMEKNREAPVVLSGGQGGDEPRSEAEVMYDALLKLGADPERLILETESQDTMENLRNSAELLGLAPDGPATVAIITSEFHQRRAAYLAEKLGLRSVPVASHTDQWFYRVNYTLREAFAMIKDALLRR